MYEFADSCDLCMENSKGPSTMRNMYNKKHYSLPPKSPNPRIAPFYSEYGSNSLNGSREMIPKHRDVNSLHQRTYSEILVMEEQPSWLDDLLDEPETPVKRGHRRSSSDSFTYIEAANANVEHATHVEYGLRNTNPAPPWASQVFDLYKHDLVLKNGKQVCVSPQSASRFTLAQEVSRTKSTINEMQNAVESCTHAAHASSETEAKRFKQ